MTRVEPPLLLASRSAARQRLLEAAGLVFDCREHGIDEEAIKRQCSRMGKSARETAESLAAEKALSLSRQIPEAWVIGGDQLLVCGENCYSKPADPKTAAEQLRRLRGRRQCLPTAVALAREGAIAWLYSETPELVMRSFSDAFLAAYLEKMAGQVLSTVGGYELEGLGLQLFEEVSGDVFTIQGLPLLPLLKALRRHGIVEE